MKGFVEDIAFGGSGVVKEKGVIFIPYTIPGEEVFFEITENKKNYHLGTLISVDKSSPYRVTAPCPYFGTCGGCQFQHIQYEKQLEVKKKIVQDALERIGKIEVNDISIYGSLKEWEYRRHVTFKIIKNEMGYIANDNKTLLAVEECIIFIDPKNKVINKLRAFIQQLQDIPEGRVTLFKLDNAQFLLYFQLNKLPNHHKEIAERAIQNLNFSGIIFETEKEKIHYGEVKGFLLIENLHFVFSPEAFLQNNSEVSLAIYQNIIQKALDLSIKNILDLYCGIGILSILLEKKGFLVHGVEGNSIAVHTAKENAKLNKALKASFEKADLNKISKSLISSFQPDLIIVNPPRTGLTDSLIESLLINPVKNIFYLSCMPATLARDLQKLKQKYQIKTIEVFDMFPQTTHMETLLTLTKK